MFISMLSHNQEYFTDSMIREKKERFMILKLDYLYFYLPSIFFQKFGLIQLLLENKKDLETFSIYNIPMIDFTDSFLKYGNVEKIDFHIFPRHFFYLCMGHVNQAPQLKTIHRFLDFLCLDIEIMNKIMDRNSISIK